MRLVVLLLGIGSGIAVRADLSYTTVTQGGCGALPGDAGRTAKYYFKSQKIKIDDSGTAIVVDMDAGTMIYIDKNLKSYSVSRLGDPREDIKQNDVPVQLNVTKTGQTKVIHGYNASEVVMTTEVDHAVSGQDDMKVQVEVEIWASPDVPGSQEWRAFYDKEGPHFSWPGLLGGNPLVAPEHGGMQRATAAVQRRMADINGVPVLRVVRIKPARNWAQTAEMQRELAKVRASLEEMRKQRVSTADGVALMLACSFVLPSSSGAFMEWTMDSSDFSTVGIPDSVFAIPTGYIERH